MLEFCHVNLADPSQRAAYRKLHNALFWGAAVTDAWLTWYHLEIPCHNQGGTVTRTYGIRDGGELVGVWSVEPKTLLDSQKQAIAVGRCFAVGIDVEHRRQGLFVALSEYAIAQERALGEYQYILGFPEIGRPVVGGHLKAGWESVQEIAVKHVDMAAVDWGVAKRSVTSGAQFVRQPADMCGSFAVTSNYLNQRWFEHPDHHYICLGRGQGYIVLKPYRDSCHVVDLAGAEADMLKLLSAAQTLCKRHRWQELNLWCAANDHYRATIERAGFVDGAAGIKPVELLAVRIAAAAALTLPASHFSIGVEEAF